MAVSSTGARRALRIFVVDDNDDAAAMLALLLEKDGHRVTVARDGPTALSLVGGVHPDVVLLDIGLPDMDGFEVARRLRALELEPRPRLIAITGYSGVEQEERARRAGMDAFLTKPVGRKALIGLLAVPGW